MRRIERVAARVANVTQDDVPHGNGVAAGRQHCGGGIEATVGRRGLSRSENGIIARLDGRAILVHDRGLEYLGATGTIQDHIVTSPTLYRS